MTDSKHEQGRSKLSRRGLLGGVGIVSGVVALFTAGHTVPGLSFANLFGSHKMGVGPQGLPINKTAKAVKVEALVQDPNWTLTVQVGNRKKSFSLAELRAMEQVTAQLPISCVEGWSQDAMWTGVRVIDLMKSVGYRGGRVTVQSLQRGGYGKSLLEENAVFDSLTLIALRVNGQVLALDHGYPARLIAPARPGALQTKWLSSLKASAR